MNTSNYNRTRWLTLIGTIVTQFALGSVYTWSLFNSALSEKLDAPVSQVAFSFGLLSLGLALNLPDSSPAEATSTMSVGWSIPVARRFTTGPVAAWHYDGSTPNMYNEFGDSVNTQSLTDPLWHASVSTLGWRVDTRLGDVRPWAQISYNQQFGDNQWKMQSGLGRLAPSTQYGNWMDVTVGADMLINPYMAAYASMSQAENMSTGEDYLYTLGVSARF